MESFGERSGAVNLLLLNWNNRMKICYIDAFSGLAGDMLAGALADASGDRETISRALEAFLESSAIGATIQWDRVAAPRHQRAQIPCRCDRTAEASPSRAES